MDKKITREDQLENKANFLDGEDNLFLVRCLACPDSGDMGRENYAMAVAQGICVWCGWKDTTNKKIFL